MKRYYWEFERRYDNRRGTSEIACAIYDRRLGFEFGKIGTVIDTDIAEAVVRALNAMVASEHAA